MTIRWLVFLAGALTVCAVAPQSVWAEDVEAVIGGRAALNTPGDVYWSRFSTALEQQGEGRLKIKLFIRGEIGPEETLFMRLRRNQVQLAGISAGGISLVEPALDILRAPFLFDSLEEAGFILDHYLKEPVTALLLEKDLVMIDWMSAGWLNFYATTPIRVPDDIKNKRIRINVDAAALMFIQEVGADYVQISFSDVLPSLQTGLVDGGEQSTQLFVTGGFGEYAPYFTLSRHAFLNAVVIANRDWFESMSMEDQDIYRKSVPADSWYRGFFTEANAVYLEEAMADGYNVLELTPVERQAWKDRTARLPKMIIERSGAGAQRLYDVILEGKATFARQQGSAVSNSFKD
jgi:TRAP-type C4-dicarboxylate transport system substrate-binding protein